jgi:endo-1,4-beta-mannosidase
VSDRFELGVNYWPIRRAMSMWKELDLGEVREEMAHIADLGFDVVRFFALTEDFLPAPLVVPAARIADLVAVAAAARDAGLRSIPTLVVINMSGTFWWPAWLDPDRGGPDLYSDPLALRSQAALAGAVAAALAGDDSVRAFDLANEIDDAWRPATRHHGWLWCALLAGEVRRAAPGVAVQFGAHMPSLAAENHMRIDDLARVVDEDCMHPYPLYSAAARSPLDPELAPFCCALTADLAAAASAGPRPILCHEFGLCTAAPGSPGTTITDDFLGAPMKQYLASEEEGAAYYQAVLERLIEIGCAGAYAWCYGDYHLSIHQRRPLATAIRERSFGLVRADRSEKPAAAVWRRLSRERPLRRPAARGAALDVPADDYYADPATHFHRLYRRWLARRGEAA